MLAGEDADKDDNIDSNVEDGEALVDNRVVEVAIVKTAGLAKEEIIETDELAIDCTVDVMDDVIGTEELASMVDTAVVDKFEIVEGDVGTVLIETVTAKDEARTVDMAVACEDGPETALEERSSALIISAAFARALDSD